MRIQPLSNRSPVYQPFGLQPAQTQPVSPSSLNPIAKTGSVAVPFGLTTISFGHLDSQQSKVATPITRPNPSLGNRLDYYA